MASRSRHVSLEEALLFVTASDDEEFSEIDSSSSESDDELTFNDCCGDRMFEDFPDIEPRTNVIESGEDVSNIVQSVCEHNAEDHTVNAETEVQQQATLCSQIDGDDKQDNTLSHIESNQPGPEAASNNFEHGPGSNVNQRRCGPKSNQRGRGGSKGNQRGRGSSKGNQRGRGRGVNQRGSSRGRGVNQHTRSASAAHSWVELVGSFDNPNSQRQYLELPGPSRTFSSLKEPLEIFQKLLTDNVLQILIEETNRYHRQQNADDDCWEDVTQEEMLAFLGVNIAMGVVRLPELSDYWNKKSFMNVPWFSTIFTRQRFYKILKYFHLCDNDKTPERMDPSYKLYKLGKLPELWQSIYDSC